jgi:RNA polymerase sigma factor (sigma-70 family)
MPTWSVHEETVFGFLISQHNTDAIFQTITDSLPSFIVNSVIFLLSAIVFAQLIEDISDMELIRKCVERSKNWNACWKEFQRRFDRHILMVIICELKKHWPHNYLSEFKEAMQDIRQEVYARLLRDGGKALREFRGNSSGSFRAYLRTIAGRLTKNFSNQKKNELRRTAHAAPHAGDDEPNEIEPVSNHTEESLQEEYLKEHIIESLRTCYPSRKFERDLMIFKLHFFEGLSAKEIHQTFNTALTVSGIETVVSRMKQALEKFLL